MGKEALTFREAVDSLVEKYVHELGQLGFLESFVSEKPDRIKDGLFVDVSILLTEEGMNPRKEIESFLSTESLAKIVTGIIWDRAIESNGDKGEMFKKVEEIFDQVKKEESKKSFE